MLYTQTVEGKTLSLIKQLSADEQFKDFRLAGGTALSLQLGHRMSVDIDLFADRPFEADKLADHFKANYHPEMTASVDNNVKGSIDGTRVSMIIHQYPWMDAGIVNEGIKMASLDDIAAMKAHAIVQNGERMKDFVDMHVLLEHRSLNEVIDSYIKKYPNVTGEMAKMGIMYHKEIQFSDKVNMLDRNLSWGQIAERLRTAAKHPDRRFSLKSIKNLVQKLPGTKRKL